MRSVRWLARTLYNQSGGYNRPVLVLSEPGCQHDRSMDWLKITTLSRISGGIAELRRVHVASKVSFQRINRNNIRLQSACGDRIVENPAQMMLAAGLHNCVRQAADHQVAQDGFRPAASQPQVAWQARTKVDYALVEKGSLASRPEEAARRAYRSRPPVMFGLMLLDRSAK